MNAALCAIYMLGVFLQAASFAIYHGRAGTPTQDIPKVFPVFLFWPIVLPVVAIIFAWAYWPRRDAA